MCNKAYLDPDQGTFHKKLKERMLFWWDGALLATYIEKPKTFHHTLQNNTKKMDLATCQRFKYVNIMI